MDDKKLNMIIGKLNSMESKLDFLVKAMIKSDLIRSDSDLDHDLILFEKRSDQDHDLSDQDLIEWFSNFLRSNGVDPEHRPLESIIRNIRYFYRKIDNIGNPATYAMKFCPPQKKPPEPEPEKEITEIYGYDISLVIDSCQYLDRKMIQSIVKQCPSMPMASNAPDHILENSTLVKLYTAKALELGLIIP